MEKNLGKKRSLNRGLLDLKKNLNGPLKFRPPSTVSLFSRSMCFSDKGYLNIDRTKHKNYRKNSYVSFTKTR